MPGMQTKLHVKADQPGIFEGENTQFNGLGFPLQKFNAVAMSAEDFDRWVKTVNSQGVALSDSAYKILANRSTTQEVHTIIGTDAMPDNVTYFNHVAADLYARVIARYHSGEAIPLDEQPGGALYRAGTPALVPDSNKGVTP
jgi:cytochrome o ubiquinol oxidase subunit 2